MSYALQNRRMAKGFTLVELLVVIAIIAILAAILFPVFITAKERARMSRCIQNLRQIHAGLLMYADDYSGKFPPQYAWSDFAGRLYPKYVRSANVFDDPALKPWTEKVPGTNVDEDYYYLGFFDGTIPATAGAKPAKARNTNGCEPGLLLVECSNWPHFAKKKGMPGAINAVTTDGHVRTIRYTTWQSSPNPIDAKW